LSDVGPTPLAATQLLEIEHVSLLSDARHPPSVDAMPTSRLRLCICSVPGLYRVLIRPELPMFKRFQWCWQFLDRTIYETGMDDEDVSAMVVDVRGNLLKHPSYRKHTQKTTT